MKSVLLFLSLHISVATLAQEKADRPYRGMAIYAEVGGAVILLLLLATYISKVYRHWFALPED